MKKLSKIAAILAALVMACAFIGCGDSTYENDGDSKEELDAPTDLVIESITNMSGVIRVDILFNVRDYDVHRAILGYSDTNDSSKAVYEESCFFGMTSKNGKESAIARFSDWTPVSGKKYYFWLKAVKEGADLINKCSVITAESPWSDVAEFTYTE